MPTQNVLINANSIKQHHGHVLHDTKRRELYFKYFKTPKSGNLGRFYWVEYGKWHPLSCWPDTSKSHAIEMGKRLYQHGKTTEKAETDDQIEPITTIQDLLVWYAERLELQGQAKNTIRNKRLIIQNWLIPHLPMVSYNTIKRIHLDSILKQVNNPLYFNQILTCLRTAYYRAKKLKQIHNNPTADWNITDWFDKKATSKKEVKLSKFNHTHYKSLKRIKKIPLRQQIYTLLIFVTAQRRAEVARIKWSHIDLNLGRWVKDPEDVKNNRYHILALPWELVNILAKYKKRCRRHQVYLFEQNDRHKPIAESTANNWINKVSNGHFANHDLRKHTRTWLNENSVDYWVGEYILNHAMSNFQLTYIQSLALEKGRTALTLWYNYIMEQSGLTNYKI